MENAFFCQLRQNMKIYGAVQIGSLYQLHYDQCLPLCWQQYQEITPPQREIPVLVILCATLKPGWRRRVGSAVKLKSRNWLCNGLETHSCKDYLNRNSKEKSQLQHKVKGKAESLHAILQHVSSKTRWWPVHDDSWSKPAGSQDSEYPIRHDQNSLCTWCWNVCKMYCAGHLAQVEREIQKKYKVESLQ